MQIVTAVSYLQLRRFYGLGYQEWLYGCNIVNDVRGKMFHGSDLVCMTRYDQPGFGVADQLQEEKQPGSQTNSPSL